MNSLGLVVLVGAGAVAGVLGVWRSRASRWRSSPGPADHVQDTSADRSPLVRLSAERLQAPLGTGATLVQFSTVFCQPCRATRRTLDEVAAMLDGVAYVEVDAASRLDLVRQLDIRRTPTVFVLGPQGEVMERATGQPRKVDVLAALGKVLV